MPFGPRTPLVKSLGGSETAALELSKALARNGHEVHLFCNLPVPPAPDAWPEGQQDGDGVIYHTVAKIQDYARANVHDLLIGVRDPSFLCIMGSQSKKKVLWAHDIFTKRGMGQMLDQMQWTFDEIWTVSEWHRHQVHEATGYPLENIVALRNGIVRYDDIQTIERHGLIYAARPERGLDNLIRPNGVMDHLPDFKLTVAMYEHFPEHMREYYERIFARMKEMPNVEYVGGKPNHELRQMLANAQAYIYPTQFEETSCILARECVEQMTPIFTTSIGALPETLGACGIYFEDWLHAYGLQEPERGSVGWCKLFAQFFREGISNPNILRGALQNMQARDDLYWDGVADMVEAHSAPKPVSVYTRALSLIKDGDVIPAKALLEAKRSDSINVSLPPCEDRILDEINELYPFIDGRKSMREHYDWVYAHKQGREDDELKFDDTIWNSRFDLVAGELAKLPDGARVIEYGSGPGHLLSAMAKRFPKLQFFGVEISPAAVAVANSGSVPNMQCAVGTVEEFPIFDIDSDVGYDAAIMSEVLEHTLEPWKIAWQVEAHVKHGGRIIITCPMGPWENQRKDWDDRQHVWHLDREAMIEMFADKPELDVRGAVMGGDGERTLGHTLAAFNADHKYSKPLDALEKALSHNARQSVGAAIIAYNNEHTILKTLNSLVGQVDAIHIAHGPSTDETRSFIQLFADQHPEIEVVVIDAPKIEPWKFGFDDARNLSVSHLNTDWILWIDTDEFLVGSIRKYARENALQSYLIAQHHFTVEPRGVPPQIDRPARMFRRAAGLTCQGHIHEHFEVKEGGPGRATILPDVDISHMGYENEAVRRKRFERNWPFLEWQHEAKEPRKLDHFLWLRDIIHRMRQHVMAGDAEGAVKLAKEAEEYYNAHHEDMSAYGPGIFMALQYLAEAYQLLGKGMPVKVTLQLEQGKAELGGLFESYEQLERVIAQMLKPEFKARTEKYY
jgi:SAM-dependent methyltransferase/glycosyltransferase involved in cell wall biosynthesis